MQSPKIIYEQLKRIDRISDIAYTYLYENYLKLDLKGTKKLIEIDTTDQESLLKQFNFGIPIPGMIYTFYHLNDKILSIINDLKLNQDIKYHDVAPILFCTNFNVSSKLIKGLNLNLLPACERLKFFDSYYYKYEEFFKDIEKLTEYNKEAINKKYLVLALSGQGQQMIKIFNKNQSAIFDYAYRSYHFDNIRKVRMIEYSQWSYIPFFSPQEAFRKINLNKIYSTYWDNRSKSI